MELETSLQVSLCSVCTFKSPLVRLVLPTGSSLGGITAPDSNADRSGMAVKVPQAQVSPTSVRWPTLCMKGIGHFLKGRMMEGHRCIQVHTLTATLKGRL